MNERLLDLVPKRFLCPYCGEWHKWKEKQKLKCHNSRNNQVYIKCPYDPPINERDEFIIYFEEESFCYTIPELCNIIGTSYVGSKYISSFKESEEGPFVTIDFKSFKNSSVGGEECNNCNFKNKCYYIKLLDYGRNTKEPIKIGFEFDQLEYNRIVKKQELQQPELHEEELQAQKEMQQSFNSDESIKENISNQTPVNEEKEETTIENNNVANTNLESDINTDEKIAGKFKDVEKLASMSAMCVNAGIDSKQMNELVILMFLKDKVGVDDSIIKMLLAFIIGGNVSGANNLMRGYAMLDAFISKKDESKTS